MSWPLIWVCHYASNLFSQSVYRCLKFLFYLGATDYETFARVNINGNSADIQLQTIDDETTLEADTLVLTFRPQQHISLQEASGEFIRSTVTVNILDNDRE